MKRIFLIDCPGVVYPSGDTEADIVLKGVTRVENLGDATDYISEILKRVKKEYLKKTYNIVLWTDHIDFLTQLAKATGRLLKGAEPDLNTCAKMMLNDFQRGRIPYFVPPPAETLQKLSTENDEKQKSSKVVATTTTTADGDKPIIETQSLHVKQIFRNIPLSTEFDEEDTTAAKFNAALDANFSEDEIDDDAHSFIGSEDNEDNEEEIDDENDEDFNIDNEEPDSEDSEDAINEKLPINIDADDSDDSVHSSEDGEELNWEQVYSSVAGKDKKTDEKKKNRSHKKSRK